MNLMILILALVCAAVIAWNLIPAFREKLRGWTTILEAAIGTAMTYFGVFSEAIQEAQVSGYIPENWTSYVPFILFAWVLLKRFQTRTPVGG
jgi:uncharacterized membrane protein